MALTDAKVEARYEGLRNDLREAGFKFVPVRGHYGGEEDSFMVTVPEASKAEMLVLGKRYNQDSVIVSVAGKNHMVFTTGEKAGQEHVGNGFERRPDAKDFYSEYCPDGKHGAEDCIKFSLRFDFDTIGPNRLLHRASACGGLIWE